MIEMPCSYNDYSKDTGLEDEELLKGFELALDTFRLAVAGEKQRRATPNEWPWPIKRESD